MEYEIDMYMLLSLNTPAFCVPLSQRSCAPLLQQLADRLHQRVSQSAGDQRRRLSQRAAAAAAAAGIKAS